MGKDINNPSFDLWPFLQGGKVKKFDKRQPGVTVQVVGEGEAPVEP